MTRSYLGWWLAPALLLMSMTLQAQTEDAATVFRKGNDAAAHSRWDEAVSEYARLSQAKVQAPSLYWNWAQAALGRGRKGEAMWALMRARDLAPQDATVMREVERLRAEMGLDPSEISLGFLGDARLIAQRFRFDAISIVLFLASLGAALVKNPRRLLSTSCFAAGLLAGLPLFAGAWREPRGVVVQKDAPLVDAPKTEAIALSNLREGEVVPLLGEEGEYVRIQDASGARGFAHKADVRMIGME